MKLRINAICQMSWKLGCPSIGNGPFIGIKLIAYLATAPSAPPSATKTKLILHFLFYQLFCNTFVQLHSKKPVYSMVPPKIEKQTLRQTI